MEIDHGLKIDEENKANQKSKEDFEANPKLDGEIQASSFLDIQNNQNPTVDGDNCEALLKWNQKTQSALSTEESIHNSLESDYKQKLLEIDEIEEKKFVNKPSILTRKYSEPKKKEEIVLNVSDLPSHMIPAKQKTDKEKFIEITLGVFLIISSAFLIHE
ncbi:unnamed protein product [Blepharisma stoltei]|uniref:Uncharacterized protein n=1 Tax=Blepharisma stoltei TaxID=1481888 RepID=A0AAU9J404_9CILI|nr:unnamed protein product [Blepharisma stoltei]